MKCTHTYHLAANANEGVFVIDPVDYPNADYMQPFDFENYLHRLRYGVEIYTIMNSDEIEALSMEYGIIGYPN